MAQHTIDLPCIADTYIDSTAPYTNYGASTAVWCGSYGGSTLVYALLKFDFSSLPLRKKIISASLRFYNLEDINGNIYTHLHIVDEEKEDDYWDWYERLATWNNTISDSIEYKEYPCFIGFSANYYHDLPLPTELLFSEKFKKYGLWFRWAKKTASGDNVYEILKFASRESSNPPMLRVVYEDVPPDAPTPIEPVGTYKDNKSVIRFSWQYNSPVGGEQTKFDLQWSIDQSNWTTISQTTANTYYDMPADTFPAGNVYWRVRTYNEYNEVSEYCAIQTFYAVGAPDTPAIYSVQTDTSRPVVSWFAFGQHFYRLQLLAGDMLIYDTGEQPNISARQHKIPVFLADGTYRARLRIRNEFGIYSEWTESVFVISTAKPAKPTLALQRSEYGIELQIADMADYALIYRSDYGTGDYVCIGKTMSTTYIDNSVRNKAEYQYYVRSVAEMASDVETYEDSDTQFIQAEFRHSLIAPVSDLTNIFVFTRSLDGPPKRSYSNSPGGSFVQYSGRKRPVWESDEHIAAGWSMTYFLRTWAEVERFIDLYERNATVLYRDAKGRKMYGVMTGLTIDDDRYGYVVSFTVNEVDFKEEMEV